MPYPTFQQDREYLLSKFRNPVFLPDAGIDNETLRDGILSFADGVGDLPHPIVKARCFEHVVRSIQIDVNPCDCYPGFGCYDRYRLPLAPLTSRWHGEIASKAFPEVSRVMAERNKAGFQNQWIDFDHSVPDYEAMLSLGFPGLLERARKYRSIHRENGTLTAEVDAYFEGLEITMSAVLEGLGRFIDFGRKHHPDHPRVIREVECLDRLRVGPPQNTYDVLQMIYLHFMFCEHIDRMQVRSLSNLDRMLNPYVQSDLSSGLFSLSEIREFFACFFMQFASINNYWGHPLYLGGTKADGTSEINDLSYLIVDVYDKLDITTPKIQIKLARNTPVEFVNKVLDLIRHGHSSFVFVCEEGLKHSQMPLGFDEETIRTCDITGCYEFAARALCNNTGVGHPNALKPFELIFNDGKDPVTGFKSPVETLKLSEIKSFGEFYRAYLAYFGEIVDTMRSNADEFEKYLHVINPSSMFSITIENSLKVGRDAFSNGSVYNNSHFGISGFGTAVDGLMAVKEFVFDKKELTLEEFGEILNNNWEGHEKLRLKILKSKLKYGNGNKEVDLYAAALGHFYGTKLNLRPNARGGVHSASGHNARQFIVLGEKTGATPDGRRRGDEMSKNLSPTMGVDRSGVTALLKSLSAINSASMPGDYPLDVMLHPSAVQGDDGLDVMRGILLTYMDSKGLAIHFNIFDADMLIDAQNNPEKYANLQVRVCGWNVLFNSLAKKEQDAYIERARNIR
ncbi:MAG: hypothetical protein GX561_12105 [Lentisphaerae bacterium]|jgi:pyruvate-formate lyase|nr:hypothetical protein [Lentisphaerota bacterium]